MQNESLREETDNKASVHLHSTWSTVLRVCRVLQD